jgi:p21-activated kinase 1
MDMALSDILSLESSEGNYIRIEESLIARITRDILRALTRIHRLNRIHRDIRSDNILLNLRGDVKLSKKKRKKKKPKSILQLTFLCS